MFNGTDIELLEIAKKKSVLNAPVRSNHVYAMIVNKGTVVGQGHNELKSHPFQKLFGSNEHAIFWHAETRAIYECKEFDLSNSYIYVARVSRAGNILPAKPCGGCMKAIKTFEIAKIFYTISKNQYGSYDARLKKTMKSKGRS